MRPRGLLLFLLLLSAACGKCQVPVDCHLQIPASLSPGKSLLSRVLSEASQSFRLSIVAEIESNLEVDLPAEPSDLTALLSAADPSISCVVIDKVLYIASDRVAKMDGNLFNFRIRYFEVPTDVDHFHLMLRSRLGHEGFLPPDTRQLINSGSGFISADAQLHPLRTEVLHDITARELLLRTASEQLLVSVIEFPPSQSDERAEKVWQFADQQWLWMTLPVK